MNCKLIDKAEHWVDFLNKLKVAKNSYVQIGFQGDAKEKLHDGGFSDSTVVEVAIANEFGTSKIPARSFMVSYFDANIGKITKASKLGLNKFLSGMPAKRALGLMGEYVKKGIQEQIDKVMLPALSPVTIAKKGSSKPLIDTGNMKQSVSYKVHIHGETDVE